ncbi:hypothetical protein WJX74_002236 [Apatococcus lobatus]|uniref:Uncharacterized protein n=1 Tax=Apatococcus lobatus TaxID=904363 RepID=A0AAW1SFK2_9CHLO
MRASADRHGPPGTDPRPYRPRPDKSRSAADRPNERGRVPYKKGNLISGPSRDPKKIAQIAAAQDEASDSGQEQDQYEHDQSEGDYASFQEEEADSLEDSDAENLDVLQAFPIQLSSVQPQALTHEDDPSPMVISTLSKSLDAVQVSSAQRAGGNRPMMPEGISQEDMETPLSEAVHKGFRNVRNTPHNDPVGHAGGLSFLLFSCS